MCGYTGNNDERGFGLSDHKWVYYENRAPFDIWRCSECGLMKQKNRGFKHCEPATVYHSIYSERGIWAEGSEPPCSEMRLDEALR